MKALNRDKLIEIIVNEFDIKDVVFEDDLMDLMQQYSDNYFINRDNNTWEKV